MIHLDRHRRADVSTGIALFLLMLLLFSIGFSYFSPAASPQKRVLASILYTPDSPSNLEKRIEVLEREVKDIKNRIRQNEDMIKKGGQGYQR